MKINYISSNNKEKVKKELSNSVKFLEINFNSDIKEEMMEGFAQNKKWFWLDLETNKMSLEEIKNFFDTENMVFFLDESANLFIVLSEEINNSQEQFENLSSKLTENNLLQESTNTNLINITKNLKLPWSAIYSEYFWNSISKNGKINLFKNNTYELNHEDVVVFILGSRYFGKIRYVYKFNQETFEKLKNLSSTITILLHGIKKQEILPFRNARDFISNFNIARNFEYHKIAWYISDNEGNLTLEPQKLLKLVDKISPCLKELNFDYWIKAVVGRMIIEKNSGKFIKEHGRLAYKDSYQLFCDLEHSTDFVLTFLYIFSEHQKFDQHFEKIKKYL